jgi:hypothetical protein
MNKIVPVLKILEICYLQQAIAIDEMIDSIRV